MVRSRSRNPFEETEVIDYEALEDEYENLPKNEKIQPSISHVNSHHDMQVRVENIKNRLRKFYDRYDINPKEG